MNAPNAVLVVSQDQRVRDALSAALEASGRFAAVLTAPDFNVDMVRESDVCLLVCDARLHQANLESGPASRQGLDSDLGAVGRLGGTPGDSFTSPKTVLRLIINGENAGDDLPPGSLRAPIALSDLIHALEDEKAISDNNIEDIVPIGDVLFSHKDNVLIYPDDDRRTGLTEKEAALLLFFYKNANQTIRRETLLESVWGYGSGLTTHTLETYIYRLRLKLGAGDGDATPLKTVDGGYRLNVRTLRREQ